MKAVIIAGGLGTRLRPLTYNIPKPIVPVVDVPFIVHQIELLKQHGIDEIIVNLHYLPNAIKDALGNGKQFGVKLYFSLEKEPLGTAGAVKNAEEYFRNDPDPLVVFNGDVLTDINITKLIDYHREKRSKATIALTPVDDPTAYGLVLMDKDGRVTEFLEKPSFERIEGLKQTEINAGIYILDPQVFKRVPKDERYMFEHHLFPGLLRDGEPVYGFTSEHYWLDIGNDRKYRMAHEAILRGEVAARIRGSREEGGYFVGERAEVAASAKVFGPVLIGREAKVLESATVKDYSVLGEKVVVGKHSIVSNSIIWKGTQIGENSEIENCIIGFNCRVEGHCKLSNATIADHSVIAKGSILSV